MSPSVPSITVGVIECSSTQFPPFIRPLPKYIASSDVHYLQVKDALSLPEELIRKELVQTYIDYVHVRCPVLELSSLLPLVHFSTGRGEQLSILLVQSVMYAAAAFANIEILQKAGYATRRIARRGFYNKAKLLYNLDCEPNHLIVIQSLLLMACWYEKPDEEKDSWHWTGVAVSLAERIGLNRNPTRYKTISDSRRRLFKRLWWSCYMYDRLIALSLRYPPRIDDEDFDVPMLSDDDFEDIKALEYECGLQQSCLSQGKIQQPHIANIFIARAKLCVAIGHVIQAQYSVVFHDETLGNTGTRNIMLAPNKSINNIHNVNTIYSELCTWAEQLPECCRYQRPQHCSFDTGKGAIIQRALLQMEFETAVSALFRPYVFLPLLSDVQTWSEVQHTARRRVQSAALQVTQLAADLQRAGLIQYLPATAVAIILSAGIVHLTSMQGVLHEAYSSIMRDFQQHMFLLEALREIYPEADFASSFLSTLVHNCSNEKLVTQIAKPGGFQETFTLTGVTEQESMFCISPSQLLVSRFSGMASTGPATLRP
ncbi:hypothetical protein GGI43DRAFT_389010 [Trichoderma evansii]